MPDPVPPVDLASLAAGEGHPGTRWRLDGEDLQANLVRLDRGDRIQPHRNDEVEVLVVVISGRGQLTLDGQVHQLAPMVLAHLPKGQGPGVLSECRSCGDDPKGRHGPGGVAGVVT